MIDCFILIRTVYHTPPPFSIIPPFRRPRFKMEMGTLTFVFRRGKMEIATFTFVSRRGKMEIATFTCVSGRGKLEIATFTFVSGRGKMEIATFIFVSRRGKMEMVKNKRAAVHFQNTFYKSKNYATIFF